MPYLTLTVILTDTSFSPNLCPGALVRDHIAVLNHTNIVQVRKRGLQAQRDVSIHTSGERKEKWSAIFQPVASVQPGAVLQEQQSFKEKKLNYNLVENIVELQTEKKRQELQIMHLTYTNQRLWLLVGIVMAFVSIFVIVVSFVKQRRRYQARIKRADERLSALLEKLRKSSAEKELRKEEIKEFLEIKENRDELENITPMLLPTEGERKFRQCFELLYPMFLPHLRERVPSITRREELFCMLVVLRQDNKKIAELMGIVPRSVLMLRHRLRQKIGLAIESSLDIFIEGIIAMEDEVIIAPESEVPEQSEDEAPQE